MEAKQPVALSGDPDNAAQRAYLRVVTAAHPCGASRLPVDGWRTAVTAGPYLRSPGDGRLRERLILPGSSCWPGDLSGLHDEESVHQ